jgi:hypothetical protein
MIAKSDICPEYTAQYDCNNIFSSNIRDKYNIKPEKCMTVEYVLKYKIYKLWKMFS